MGRSGPSLEDYNRQTAAGRVVRDVMPRISDHHNIALCNGGAFIMLEHLAEGDFSRHTQEQKELIGTLIGRMVGNATEQGVVVFDETLL